MVFGSSCAWCALEHNMWFHGEVSEHNLRTILQNELEFCSHSCRNMHKNRKRKVCLDSRGGFEGRSKLNQNFRSWNRNRMLYYICHLGDWSKWHFTCELSKPLFCFLPFICCNIYFCRFLITRAVEMIQFTCHLLVMEYFDECL